MQSLQSNPVMDPRVLSVPKWRTSAIGAWVAGLSAIAGGKARSERGGERSLELRTAETKSERDDELLQLREAKSRAKHETKSKSLFIANASHEIRNMLGPVIAYSELLKAGNQDPAAIKEILDGISRSSAELMTLVNDLVEMTKIGEGRFEVVKRAFYLRPLIRDIEHFCTLEAQKKGLSFKVEFGENVPDRIYSDPCRVKQVLLNLLGNAIKFTDLGEVQLSIDWDKGTPGNLRFLVRDTGSGLTPDEMESVFEPFSQCTRSARLRRQGAGLGLAISRQIAVSLNGSLRVLSSHPGVGTTFEFILYDIADLENDFAIQHGPAEGAFEAVKSGIFEGKKILVADDSVESQNLIWRLLRSSGVEVETASDGEEALEKAIAGAFDVVFMDVEMPGLNGYEAVRKLRSRGYDGPVVALTGHTNEDDVENCIRAGFTEHVSKPVNKDQLVRIISKLVHS